MKIRQATIKDVDQIYEVFLDMIKSEDAAFKKTDSFLMRRRKKRADFITYSKKGLRQEILDKKCKYLVAVIDDKIVGYARGEIQNHQNFFFQKEKVGYLHALAVLKKYRGQKISSQLHQALEVWFIKRNVILINLSVANNNPAIDIYKKWGYKTYIYKMFKKLKK